MWSLEFRFHLCLQLDETKQMPSSRFLDQGTMLRQTSHCKTLCLRMNHKRWSRLKRKKCLDLQWGGSFHLHILKPQDQVLMRTKYRIVKKRLGHSISSKEVKDLGMRIQRVLRIYSNKVLARMDSSHHRSQLVWTSICKMENLWNRSQDSLQFSNLKFLVFTLSKFSMDNS